MFSLKKMSLIESCWKHRQAIIDNLLNGNSNLKIAIAKLLKYTVRLVVNKIEIKALIVRILF